MAGIKHLKEVQIKKGNDFLDNILNHYVVINENINGTFFGVKKDKEDSFTFFKKAGQITYVDQMLMKFYNQAINYFNTLSPEKIKRIPSNFYFGFQYITNKDGAHSKYDRKPKNNLVLSYIHKLDDNGKIESTIQSKDQLERWAYYLEVEPPPIIFEGKLDDDQKTSLLEFVHTPFEELTEKFKTTSFTKYIVSVLNTELNASFLKNKLSDGIEEVIFRFYDENIEDPKANVFLAKLVDPVFQSKSKKNKKKDDKKSNDYIWLIVIDLMNKIEMYSEDELKSICNGEEDYDNRFIQVINTIFKEFIKEYSDKYDGLRLDVPDYLKRPEFEIDFELIQDGEIVNLIKDNDTFKEIYRILANFFRKTRKKSSSSFFNLDLLNNLNIQIKKLKRVIMGDSIYEGLFPTFGEYVNNVLPESIFEDSEKQNFRKNGKLNKVNVLIGTYQPFHNGYLKAIEKLQKKNGLKCVLVALHKPNANNLITKEGVLVMLTKVQQAYPDMIEDIKVVESISIKNIMSQVVPEYQPILWAANSSRTKDYMLQFEYIKKKNTMFRIDDDFKLVELKEYLNSKEVIHTIKDGDYGEFKKLVPKAISSEFFNLQKELESNS